MNKRDGLWTTLCSLLLLVFIFDRFLGSLQPSPLWSHCHRFIFDVVNRLSSSRAGRILEVMHRGFQCFLSALQQPFCPHRGLKKWIPWLLCYKRGASSHHLLNSEAPVSCLYVMHSLTALQQTSSSLCVNRISQFLRFFLVFPVFLSVCRNVLFAGRDLVHLLFPSLFVCFFVFGFFLT